MSLSSSHRTLTLRLRRPPAPAAVMAAAVTEAPDAAWLWTPLNQTECARWLGVDRTTLSLWTTEGRIPYTRVGQMPRYLRGELLPLLRAGQLPADGA